MGVPCATGRLPSDECLKYYGSDVDGSCRFLNDLSLLQLSIALLDSHRLVKTDLYPVDRFWYCWSCQAVELENGWKVSRHT